MTELATLIEAVQDLTENVDLNQCETSQRLTALEGADQVQAAPQFAPQDNNNAKIHLHHLKINHNNNLHYPDDIARL